MFDKMKKIVAWQSDGGGFIPAMADILLAKPGASEKKNIKSNHYQTHLKSIINLTFMLIWVQTIPTQGNY